MNRTKTISLLVILAAAAGCDVQTAQAPRANLFSQDLRTFPAEGRQNLTDNKVFYWKTNMTPLDVAIATSNGRRVDELEIMRANLVAPIQACNDRIAALEEPVAPVRSRLAEIVARLAETTRPPGEEEKARLLAEKAEKEAQLAPVEKQIADETANRGKFEAEQSDLAGEMIGSGLKIAHAMDTAPFPKRVRLTFNDDGTVALRLDRVWEEMRLDETGNGLEKIESEPVAQVRDIRYAALGGKLEFTIDLANAEDPSRIVETLTFKLHRLSYATTDRDGRVVYGGDVEKTLADGTARKGSAKLKTELTTL